MSKDKTAKQVPAKEPTCREVAATHIQYPDAPVSDAYLDGLVMARTILRQAEDNAMLGLIARRLQDRYGIKLWALKSPVDGD